MLFGAMVKKETGKPKKAVLSAPSVRASFVVRSQTQVAGFWGVTHGTVKDWVRNGMPGEAGRYDLAVIAQWRLARTQKPASIDLAEQKKGHEIEKLRKENAKLDRQEEKELGGVIDRRTMEAQLSILFRTEQQVIMRVPQGLRSFVPDELAGPAIAEQERQLRLALGDLERKMVAATGMSARTAALVNKILDKFEAQDVPADAAA